MTGAQTQSDYEMAAQNYYDYLKDNGAYLPTQYTTTALKASFSGEIDYFNSGWISIFSSTTSPAGKSYNGEAITVIPSSAGKLYGTVLTGIANVFGYRTNSSMNTDSEEGKEDEATTSASVTASPDVTYRQLGASQQYLSLCADQQYIEREKEDEPVKVLDEAGDARQYALVDVTRFGDNGVSKTQFIGKSCITGFSYTFPVIYR